MQIAQKIFINFTHAVIFNKNHTQTIHDKKTKDLRIQPLFNSSVFVVM